MTPLIQLFLNAGQLNKLLTPTAFSGEGGFSPQLVNSTHDPHSPLALPRSPMLDACKKETL